MLPYTKRYLLSLETHNMANIYQVEVYNYPTTHTVVATTKEEAIIKARNIFHETNNTGIYKTKIVYIEKY